MRGSDAAVERFQRRKLGAELRVNTRPDRSLSTLAFRRIANWLRTSLYFFLKCRYARRLGFVRIPWSVTIWSPNKIVQFGDRVQLGPRCVVQCDIKFGNDVLIAGDVAFVGRNDHCADVVGKTIWDSPRGIPELITIEDDVWIGYGAIVLSGITIGKGSVVAAGAVVASDVVSYSIVGGVPAKEIAKRFSSDEIKRHEELLRP